MNELRYSGYYTDCYYKRANNNWHHSDNHACFAELLRNYNRTIPEFKVILYRLGGRQTGQSSICLVGRKEIGNHLKQVQDLVNFDYSITESEKFFEVYLKISKDEPNLDLSCRFVLTWLRYLYEFPYNVIMLDVNRLKQNLPSGTFESSINLFGLIGSTYREGFESYFNSGHTIHYICSYYYGGKWCSLISKSVLKKRLRDKGRTRVNDLIPLEVMPGMELISKDCFGCYKDLEFWESDKKFLTERLPILLKNYEKLKIKKIYE